MEQTGMGPRLNSAMLGPEPGQASVQQQQQVLAQVRNCLALSRRSSKEFGAECVFYSDGSEDLPSFHLRRCFLPTP